MQVQPRNILPMTLHTKEPQYQYLLDQKDFPSFGIMSGRVWQDDPRRLGFVLSRYKFVAKMFSGLDRVLEIGCADAFGTRIVKQEVAQIVATDFDPVMIDDAKSRQDPRWLVEYQVHDMVTGPFGGDFDGAYSCDVIEHIDPADERAFVDNMAKSLKPTGTLIVGTPSLESQPYASPGSRAGHRNCKSGNELKSLLKGYFHQVFLFSMNDEVVHTGFYPMAHYLFALCCHKK